MNNYKQNENTHAREERRSQPTYRRSDNDPRGMPFPRVTESSSVKGNIRNRQARRGFRGGKIVGVGRNLPPEIVGGAGVRGGIASTSRGTSVWRTGSSGNLAHAKGTGKRFVTAARKLRSDRRMAKKILERYGEKQAEQESERHARSLEWAKRVLSGGDNEKAESNVIHSSVKRQRSNEGESSICKKPRTEAASTSSEIAQLGSSVELGVYDRSREDGAISREEWKQVAAAISAVFMEVVKGNPGPPPKCESAGWHHGLHKLIKCSDERSASLYKEAVARVGEVWKGARLEAVVKSDLPVRPRARVWLPSEPSTPKEIEEIMHYCNPSLPTHDWRVIRLEKTAQPYRQALILLNKESLGPLRHTKGAISYGFESVVLNVLPMEHTAEDPQSPEVQEDKGEETQMGMNSDPVLSDTVSIGDGSSIDGSDFSPKRMYDEDRVGFDFSAELALLESTLQDEYPSD